MLGKCRWMVAEAAAVPGGSDWHSFIPSLHRGTTSMSSPWLAREEQYLEAPLGQGQSSWLPHTHSPSPQQPLVVPQGPGSRQGQRQEED